MGEGWSYLGIIGRSGCGADFRKIIDYSENVIFRILVLWNVNRCYVQKKMFQKPFNDKNSEAIFFSSNVTCLKENVNEAF